MGSSREFGPSELGRVVSSLEGRRLRRWGTLKNGHCAFLQRRLIKDIGLTCSRFMGPRIFTSESLRTVSFKDHLRTVYR
jgi:hypothetical protein